MAGPVTSFLNRVIGPSLLRLGIIVRSSAASLSGGQARTHAVYDNLVLMPWAQKMISIEVQRAWRLAASPKKNKFFSWKTIDSMVERQIGIRIADKEKGNEEQSEEPLTVQQLSEVRLQALEKNLRSVLVPYELWSDVVRWKTMYHLLTWVRGELLIAKYGEGVGEALVAYPQLRLSPQILPMKQRKRRLLKLFGMLPEEFDNRRISLPHSAVVVKAFFMEKWNARKDTKAQYNQATTLCQELGGKVAYDREGGYYSGNLPLNTDISSLSFETIMELAVGHVQGCGPFNALCEDAGIFQLWTKEYVSGLATYLRKRSEQFQGKTLILDIGAGDGVLAHFLQDMLAVKQKTIRPSSKSIGKLGANVDNYGPTVIAIDNGSWGITPSFPVERLNVQDALSKYCGAADQQVIIICSWMLLEDYTYLFRQFKVEEYILIGQYDDGICGDNWATWGNPDFCTATGNTQGNTDEIVGTANNPPAPYVVDGYDRKEFDNLVPYQFSRLDTAFSKSGSTVSFRRRNKSKS